MPRQSSEPELPTSWIALLDRVLSCDDRLRRTVRLLHVVGMYAAAFTVGVVAMLGWSAGSGATVVVSGATGGIMTLVGRVVLSRAMQRRGQSASPEAPLK